MLISTRALRKSVLTKNPIQVFFMTFWTLRRPLVHPTMMTTVTPIRRLDQLRRLSVFVVLFDIASDASQARARRTRRHYHLI